MNKFAVFQVICLSTAFLFDNESCCGQNDLAKSPTEEASATLFETRIRPLLEKYCIDCHEPGNGGYLDFLNAKNEADVASLFHVYTGVVETLENGSMPPGDSVQPSNEERQLVVDWLKKSLDLKPGYFDRLAPYVVETYQDQKGNLWFGTMQKGAARYDGKSLEWFSQKDGLPSNTVPTFAEDKEGRLWVGTHEGVAQFDGERFIAFGTDKGLPAGYGRIQSDREGNIWAGMNSGVFRYDGSSFSEFEVPVNKNEIKSYAIHSGQISMALHDSKGNFWFSSDGAGAFRFDGNTFTHFTKGNGLCSNNVTGIMEDRQGNIWFTCMQSYQPKPTGDGGVCRYDGKGIAKFPTVNGLANNDIYTIYETSSGDIWIGASGVGVYRYDGHSFTLVNETDRMHWTRHLGLQGMMEDKNGTLWFGFSGGLFRFNGKSFFNVTEEGPWKSEVCK